MILRINATLNTSISIEANPEKSDWDGAGEEERKIFLAERLKEHLLEEIDTLVDELVEKSVLTVEEEINYGDYVQVDDRFETVGVWTKEMESKCKGKWTPVKITEEKYLKEKEQQQKTYK